MRPALAGDDKPLTNADVLKMAKSQFDEDTLLSVIDSHPAQFDTSPDALVELKQGGVGERVIRAMIAANKRPTDGAGSAGAPSANAAMPNGMPPGMSPEMMGMLSAMGMGGNFGTVPMPQFLLVDGEKKHKLSPQSSQVAQSDMQGIKSRSSAAEKLLALAEKGLQFAALAGGPMGMAAHQAAVQTASAGRRAFGLFRGSGSKQPTVTMVWALQGKRSANLVDGHKPSFQADWADIPGIDASVYEPVIVKLVSTRDNWRVVGASEKEMNQAAMMSGPTGELTEDRIPCKVDKKGPGSATVTPLIPLPSGQYGLVLRPPRKYQAQGTAVMAARQLFYSVWDFEIE